METHETLTQVQDTIEGILDGEMEAGQYRLLRAQCLIAEQLARVADVLENIKKNGLPVEQA